MRVGWGVDAHRFAGEGSTLLAGVVVDEARGVAGTSDADVLAHAVADGLLGACALGDLGEHFPSSDPRWKDADSMAMLTTVVGLAEAAGYAVTSVDATVVAQRVRVAPHRDRIRDALAAALRVDRTAISVKATTTDGMGFLGRDEGIAALAVVVVIPT
jgi:2-C-methyl-D-erythritol 2,4-cyclodiphosphate synthase